MRHRTRSAIGASSLGIAFLAAMLFLGVLGAGAAVGDTIRVSQRPNGAGVNGDSEKPAISADGRFIAFESFADNLVSNDGNLTWDVFVADTETGSVELVSVSSSGTQANGPSHHPDISADGRFVAFESSAATLVAGDANGVTDAFVHDRETGGTTRVSVASNGEEANGPSTAAAISADGRYVVFQSTATNLVDGDTNGVGDVFIHDTSTGSTMLVSVDSAEDPGNGASFDPAVSADGSVVAFSSDATDLVGSDGNGNADVFLRYRDAGTTVRVSVSSTDGEADLNSIEPSLTPDGRFTVFTSFATNLVSDDDNASADVFVHDNLTGATTRVSVSSDGDEGDNSSSQPSVSSDGQLVAFTSLATDLVDDDTKGFGDVFVRDLEAGTTTRVSIAADGTEGDAPSAAGAVSSDGRFVAFLSSATNLVPNDTNGFEDVFRHQILADAPTPGDDNPFTDDDGSTFEADIEALARAGITKGCNPPDNTRFCPTDPVTRGQMAAFLVRALDYSNDGGGDLFSDDDGSTFEADIDRLGTAGVTKGCNPPDNTQFCPSDPVTRGQMAAFLVRALGYTDDGGGNLFTDADGSTFEADIDRLGTAGVTKGCNPPDNTRFCPTDPVTRGQMAAFLTRALDLK